MHIRVYKRNALILITLLLSAQALFSQHKDSVLHFSGSAGVTHNGISLVPTFSLGKPAAIVMLSVGRNRLTFEPDLRFALEGKPWSFVFWLRYKLVNNDKFRVTIGTHPALNFRTMQLPVNGDTQHVIVARRFLAGELSPNYMVSKKVSIGIYYLFARGFEKTVPKHNHFITVNSVISGISLPAKLSLRLHPQVYYLRQDQRDGFYVTSSLSLTRKDFPLSVSAIFNKTISSNIPGNKDFVWNTSLVYSFHKSYARH